MSNELFEKTFSNTSNANRAARAAGFEPIDYKVAKDGERFRLVRRDPVNAAVQAAVVTKAPKAAKPAKAEASKVDAPKVPVQTDDEIASIVFLTAKPKLRHVGAVMSARKGVMPKAPDLSSPNKTYAYVKRNFLDKVEAAVAAGDRNEVEKLAGEMAAAKSLPKSPTLKGVYVYAKLAFLAMQSGAAA